MLTVWVRGESKNRLNENFSVKLDDGRGKWMNVLKLTNFSGTSIIRTQKQPLASYKPPWLFRQRFTYTVKQNTIKL